MFVLSAPSKSGRSAGRPSPYTADSACTSIGSPSDVPVPWHSTKSTSPGDSPASASAARSTFCCDVPFGAVIPLLAPSWLTALPRTTASTGCPLARASDRRSRHTTTTPSPRP